MHILHVCYFDVLWLIMVHYQLVGKLISLWSGEVKMINEALQLVHLVAQQESGYTGLYCSLPHQPPPLRCYYCAVVATQR